MKKRLSSEFSGPLPESLTLFQREGHVFLTGVDEFWTNFTLAIKWSRGHKKYNYEKGHDRQHGISWEYQIISPLLLKNQIPKITNHLIDWTTLTMDHETLVICHYAEQGNDRIGTLELNCAVLATSSLIITKILLIGPLIIAEREFKWISRTRKI